MHLAPTVTQGRPAGAIDRAVGLTRHKNYGDAYRRELFAGAGGAFTRRRGEA
ncbi:MAG: hypothetical protein M3P18_01090 [Actinomycetota bacterium]|nr:hypothetical protein [Actinomycetota bacterium]